ncbi:MAG: methionine--tRNA ligase [bacterium]
MAGTFYITTPIYYVNAAPHIGHAYTSLAVDTLARWHRLLGDDTWFLSGTDEHGLKIEQSARAAGLEPQAQADRWSAPFRAMSAALDLTNDDFIRTTEARHKAVVAEMWRRMEAAGDIYLSEYAGWYSVGDEAWFSADEVVDGKSPTGHPVEWMEEVGYFFRLSKYGEALLAHLDAHPDFVRPASRYNELRRFIEGGLQDISISRSTFSWGIPVPGADGHVVYVWVDALTNYISALGGPGAPAFERFWPSAIHVIGKDILRFHAVYWPAFLMSAGLPLPKGIFAHGWWTIDGQKMSKSLGNVVDPFEMAQKYGPDAFRYFLLREVTFGTDGDFSEQGLKNRYRGELANDYGNLCNRTLGMLRKYRGGVMPARGEAGPEDATLAAVIEAARAQLVEAMDEMAFHRAIAAIWSVVGAANKYVVETAPWVLAKGKQESRLGEVLYTLCETLRLLGVWTLPFLPRKAAALLDQLGVPADLRTWQSTLTFGGLPAGLQTQEGEPLFPRLEDEDETLAEPAKPVKPAKAPKAPTPAKESPVTETPAAPAAPAGIAPIEYDDFAKLELRSARIVEAEPHPNADKLIKLTVDAGEGRLRTVCAGIAAWYSPADLVGKSVILLANLKPRKLRGVMSEGMLLAGGEETVTLITLPGDHPPGTRIS